MPVTTDTLLQAWSQEFIQAFTRANSLYPIINTDYQAAARNTDKFNVLVFETVPVVTDTEYTISDKTDVLTTRNSYNASAVQVEWERVHQTALDVQENYVAATRGSIFRTYARLEADKFVRKLDERIWGEFRAGDRADVQLVPGSADTGTVVQLQGFEGTAAANHVNPDGTEDGDQNLVFETLLKWKTQLRSWDMMPPTGENISWDVTMNPALFASLTRSAANMAEPIMVEFINGREQRSIFGAFNIHISNELGQLNFTTATGAIVASGGANGFPMLFSNRDCVTAGIRFRRNRLLAPLQPGNDGADYFKLDSYMQSYQQMVDNRKHAIVGIANGVT